MSVTASRIGKLPLACQEPASPAADSQTPAHLLGDRAEAAAAQAKQEWTDWLAAKFPQEAAE